MTLEESVRRLVSQALDEREAGRSAVASPPASDRPAGGSATGHRVEPERPAERPAELPTERPADGASVAIAIGSDHGGFALKERLVRQLREEGFAVTDCGTTGPEAVDYPEFAHTVARLVASGGCQWGIVVDGAGIGSCMVANKVPGVRAALCYDVSSARNSREHNHANVLTLGARMIGEGVALDVVHAWLETPWGPGRHAARVAKITEIERRYVRREARA